MNENMEKTIQLAVLGAVTLGVIAASNPIKLGGDSTTSKNIIQASVMDSKEVSTPTPSPKREKGVLTRSEVNKLVEWSKKPGSVSQKDALKVLGEPGRVLESTKVSGLPMERVVYYPPSQPGTAIVVGFQDGVFRGYDLWPLDLL